MFAQKEPVKLRRKPLKDGAYSLYLDIYEGWGSRKYEFLKLYLIPVRTTEDKERNAVTLRSAKAIQARRILEITSARAGLPLPGWPGDRVTLAQFLPAYIDRLKRRGQVGVAQTTAQAGKYMDKYAQSLDIKLSSIDKRWCRGFASFLKSTSLSPSTQQLYYSRLITMLSDAVEAEAIPDNPALHIPKGERPRGKPAERVYLTVEELRAIEGVTLLHDKNHVREAFLFACYTGLRVSDIGRIRWSDITEDALGSIVLSIEMKKTGSRVTVPICRTASQFLPQQPTQRHDDMPIFPKVTSHGTQYLLGKLAKEAGIKKHITFHTARHTFATILSTRGADIHTISELLGHADLRTTQIYAKIVDSRRAEVISLLDGIKD